MTNGICSKCGAGSVYLRRNNGGAKGVNMMPLGGSLLGAYAAVDTYACSACGYFENYIRDPKKRRYIAEHWEHIPPSAPPGPPDAATRRLDR